jgi:small Trp-rich protein
MLFVIVGVVLVLLKVAAFGPVAEWSWLLVLAPFGLAAVWWAFADATGLTRRRAMDKMEQRKVERRKRDMAALGLGLQPVRPAARSAPARRAEPKDSKPKKSSILPEGDSRHEMRKAEDARREPRL